MDTTIRQTVLITGAGRGIGEAIARWFIEHNHDVILNYRRTQGKSAAGIERLREYAREHGVRAVSALGDISESRDVEKMFHALTEQHGITQLDHLILNAAAAPFKPFTEMTRNDWKLLLGTNLTGNVACVTQAVKLMPRGSSICAISSLGSRRTLPNYPLGVMKAALEQLIRYLDVELRPQGIRCNAICGGFVNTDMLPILREKWPLMEYLADDYIIEPSEIAEVAGFLSSKAASAIRGESVLVDAGMTLAF